jgi:hypothetical protein
MSVKQCRKCGRFKGASHSCAPVSKALAKTVKSPNLSSTEPKLSPNPPSISSSQNRAPVRPDPIKVAAILRDPKKLASAIRSLDFALQVGYKDNVEQDKMRVRLEASFGKIDWNR